MLLFYILYHFSKKIKSFCGKYELFTKYAKADSVQLTIVDKNGIGEDTISVPLIKR